MLDFQSQFKAARRVSTPLVAVRTFDAASTIASVKQLLKPVIDETPMIVWDAVTGLTTVKGHMTASGYADVNEVSRHELMLMLGQIEAEASTDLTLMLVMAQSARQDTIIFMSNAHLFWNEPTSIQAIWNLRDTFKARGNMLVLLCSSGSILPSEIASDVLVLDEPLPTLQQLEKVVFDSFEYANWPKPDVDTVKLATNALIGLPMFPAEQAIAMSQNMTTGKLDIADLWDRKRQAINATPGLTVWMGTERLDDIGGLAQIKTFLREVMNGKQPPRCVVFVDEIEKASAGTGSDTSGVKTELTGAMLSWTTDKDIDGIALLGVQGSGKSQIAKNTANEFGIPCIAFDLAGMQGSLVGQSGANLRAAIATVNAISDGKILLIATSNNFDALPSELRDRFQLGQFFFDLPDETERASIWQLYRTRYSIADTDTLPADTGWNGRSIRECCKKADRMGLSLKEASQYVIPVSVSAKDTIARLRSQCDGKYLSASHAGLYSATGHVDAVQTASTSVAPVSTRKMRAQ